MEFTVKMKMFCTAAASEIFKVSKPMLVVALSVLTSTCLGKSEIVPDAF